MLVLIYTQVYLQSTTNSEISKWAFGGDLCVLGWVLVGGPDSDLSCGAWGTEGSCGGRDRCRAGEEAGADALLFILQDE